MFTINAIVLKKMPVGEYDQLVTLYSREFGKIRALAKGYHRTHSRLRGHLDEGDRIQCIIVPGAKQWYVRSVVSEQKLIASHIYKSANAYPWVALELYDRMTPEQSFDAGLWELLIEWLSNAWITEAHPNKTTISFIERFLIQSGFGPITMPITSILAAQHALQKMHQISLNTLHFIANTAQNIHYTRKQK